MRNIRCIVKSHRGFSLIELTACLGVMGLIFVGAGYLTQNAAEQAQNLNKRANALDLSRDLRSWVQSFSKQSNQCTDMAFNFSKIEDLIEGASTNDGVPFEITTSPSQVIREGSTLPGQQQLFINKMRFKNAKKVLSNNTTGENLTYLTGKIELTVASGQKIFPPDLIGEITIGITDFGIVKNCNRMESIGDNSVCSNIEKRDYETGKCELNLVDISNKHCPSGETFSGFNFETGLPICVNTKSKCQDSSSGKRGALIGLKRIKTNESTLDGNDSISNVTVCGSIPNTPLPAENAIIPPAPNATESVVDLGVNGSPECPNAASYTDWYNACRAAKTYYNSIGLGQKYNCPSPPTRCFKTMPQKVPTTFGTRSHRIDTSETGRCGCGSVPTISNGEYCGSYFGGGYGLVNTSVNSSIVYQCVDGNLKLVSGAKVTPPTKAFQRGQLRKASSTGGSFYKLL